MCAGRELLARVAGPIGERGVAFEAGNWNAQVSSHTLEVHVHIRASALFLQICTHDWIRTAELCDVCRLRACTCVVTQDLDAFENPSQRGSEGHSPSGYTAALIVPTVLMYEIARARSWLMASMIAHAHMTRAHFVMAMSIF